jgi:hypothetical protein
MSDEREVKIKRGDEHDTDDDDVEAHVHKTPGATRGANDDDGDDVEAHVHKTP